MPDPRIFILAKNVNIVPLLDLCSRDLMVASIDLVGIGKLIIGSAYFPYDSVSNPPKELTGGLLQGKRPALPVGVRY